MAINFDALPKTKPESEYSLPTIGYHRAVVESAEVKVSSSGNEYLNLKFKTDEGTFYDMVMDSDKPALAYKLARFVTACKLPLTGTITIADLAKIVAGKEIVVDVDHQDNTYNGKTTKKAVANMFDHDIFYPIEMLAELTGSSEEDAVLASY